MGTGFVSDCPAIVSFVTCAIFAFWVLFISGTSCIVDLLTWASACLFYYGVPSFAIDRLLTGQFVLYRKLSSAIKKALHGEPSAPDRFNGAALKKYLPSLTAANRMPSSNTMPAPSKIKCTSIGASSGPTVCDSFPNSRIPLEAKTFAASEETTASPLIRSRFAASGSRSLDFSYISIASWPETIP